MAQLEEKDIELIEKAKDAIARNYDGERFLHTVGAALRTKEGKVYVGVNVYSVHGACAELIALGATITAGERVRDDRRGERGERRAHAPMRELPADALRLRPGLLGGHSRGRKSP